MVQRRLALVAALTAVLVLTACAAGLLARSPKTPVNHRATTPPAVQPDTLTGAAPAGREVYELTGFVSPTGNVSCMIDALRARCDIIDRDWSPPARPADCEFDYGQGISLAPGEQAQFVCAGDTAFGADEVLPYGESITAGVLQCESAESGITCRDIRSSHGFSISGQAHQLF
jgi:hypothetical protein